MIYPAKLAEQFKDRAGERYRPSNGTEGEVFWATWCCRCAKDKAMSEGKDVDLCGPGELCQIIAATMAFDATEEGYPDEWQYGADGQPCCTAFVLSDSAPPLRCQHTADLFEGGRKCVRPSAWACAPSARPSTRCATA